MIKCNLCGSERIKVFCDCKDFVLLKCKDCNLLFKKQEGYEDKFYSKDYFEDVHKNFFKYCRKDYERYIKESEKLRMFLKTLVALKKLKNNGKLLDIGCATGVFLDMAKKKGYDVLGVDVSNYACDYASENFKVKTKCGELEKLKFKEKSFDVITMWDVLKHTKDPKSFLMEANKLLKNDGILFVFTINDACLMSWIAKSIYYLSFKKIKVFFKWIYPIHHNYHFSEKNLDKYLELTGFEALSKEKSEMPVENIEKGFLFKTLARIVYFFSNLTNTQYEIKIFAKKVRTV